MNEERLDMQDVIESQESAERAIQRLNAERRVLREENRRLVAALHGYAECADGCGCMGGRRHDAARKALNITIDATRETPRATPRTGGEE